MPGSMTTPRAAAALALMFTLAACQKAPAPTTINAPPPAVNVAVPPETGADAADAADVSAYLQSLYAHYRTTKHNTFQMFDANAHEVFDEPMLRLLKRDEAALKGELGVIDGDWLCDCQDFASLKATIAVQSATPTSAKATSDFVDVGIPGQAARHDAFELVKEHGRWRIHDIKAGDEPWLRTQLEDEIKQLEAKGGGNRAEAG